MESVNVGLAIVARKFFDMEYVRQVVPALHRALKYNHIRICSPQEPILDAEGAEEASRLFAREGCDLLVVVCATFADASIVAALAKAIDLPMVLWALAEPASETGRLRLNSFCGANLAANALVGLGRPFSFVYGSPDDPDTRKELQSHLRVETALKALARSRIALFGVRPEGYYACNFDEMELRRVVGADVEYVSLPELQARAEAGTQDEASFLAGLRERTAGLESANLEEVRKTGRSYAALRTLASERRFDAVAVRCWPEFFADYGHAVCGALSRLTDDGIMAACEADVNGAVTMMAQHSLTGGASFLADLVSAERDENSWLLWHCGAGPLTMASPERAPVVGYHPNRKLAASLWFGMKPGSVTIARLSYQRGRYRMLVAKGEVIDRPGRYQGSNALVRMEGDALDGARRLVEMGFEHHVAMCYGDVAKEMAAMADRWGIELVKM
ncbi:MAG: L-fucose/L-arabinose isomerase family protein [Chloroflexota bacterium]|jgi:L-fucose isomerase-like protein